MTTENKYRSLMYDKCMVAEIEKNAIKAILKKNELNEQSFQFITKATEFFPKLAEKASILSINKKNKHFYFIEEVGSYLWEKWNKKKTTENQNNLIMYLTPVIDGALFSGGHHKYRLNYDELFQQSILIIIKCMPNYDKNRGQVFQFFSYRIKMDIITYTTADSVDSKKYATTDDPDYPVTLEAGFSDAELLFKDFLLFLDSVIVDDYFNKSEQSIFKALKTIISRDRQIEPISKTILSAIKKETGAKIIDIEDALNELRVEFGQWKVNEQETRAIETIVEGPLIQ